MYPYYFSTAMYWDSYDNTQAEQFNPNMGYSQPPQYSQTDQFMGGSFPTMPPLQDQEMPLQEALQDPNMFQMSAQNQMQFQEPIQPIPMEEPIPQTPLPTVGINEQVPQEVPEAPGSNVRITRARLRGTFFL